jgi:hypothetical protein
MGLLDDAIREHLELKRRHGADPQEVERQEQEVLGADRRGEFAPTAEAEREPEAEASSAAPFDAASDEPEEPGAVPEPEGPPEFDDRTRVVDEVAASPESEVPEPGQEAAAPGYDEDPWLEEERDEVPTEESLEPSKGGEEDVLEETPEFLQETPEHDRLWFEQRPPRDFDWDK